MGRPRSANSISLFPFLAVLVCTMGALILLLLTTTRHLREEAVQRAGVGRPAPVAVPPPAFLEDDPPLPASIPLDPSVQLGVAQSRPAAMPAAPPDSAPPPAVPRLVLPEPVDPNVALRATVARLLALRDQQMKVVDAGQAAVAKAKDALKSGAAKLAKLNVKRDEVRRKKSLLAQTTEDLEKKSTGLSGQLAKVRDEIRRTRVQRSAAPSKYALVPFDSRTGTNRRPIYIEFRDDTIRFMPEGVTLSKDDVEGFTLGFNPLLAGSEALIRYWSVKSREAGRSEPPPYVLLIVRPSGVKLYPARVLLENLSAPHGYELVEEDLPLAFPKPDPLAVAVCREAVEQTLLMRKRIEEELAERGHVPRVVVGDRGIGRWGDREQPGGSGLFPRRGDGSGPGSADPRSDLPRGSGGDGTGTLPPLPRGGDGVGDALAGQPRTGTGNGRGVGAFPGGSDLPHGMPGNGMPVVGGTPAVSGMPAVGGSPAVSGMPAVGGPANAKPDWLGAVRGDPSGALPPLGNEPGLGDFAPRTPGLLPPNLAAQQLGTPGTLPGESSGGLSIDGGSPSDTGSGNAAEAGPSSPWVDGAPGTSRNGGLVPPQGVAGTPSASGSPIGRGPGRGTGGLSAGSSVPNGSATGSGSVGSGGPGGPNDEDGSNRSGPGQQPTFDLPWYRRPHLLGDNEPHRRKWGYSDPQGTIGFERDIDVQIEANRIVMGHQVIPIDRETTREELTQRMLTAVELRTRTWGHAPKNFYWAPTLNVTIGTGGEPHYQALQGPLGQWGVPTKVDRRPPAPSDAEGRR